MLTISPLSTTQRLMCKRPLLLLKVGHLIVGCVEVVEKVEIVLSSIFLPARLTVAQ